MAIAAQHRLVRRRYPLRKDVAVEAPARPVIELPKAEKEPRKRRPFRLVDLWQVCAAHEQVRLSGTGLQSHGGIVERGRAGAENADFAAHETCKVDVVGGMEHASKLPTAVSCERRKRWPIGGPRSIPAPRQHHFAGK